MTTMAKLPTVHLFVPVGHPRHPGSIVGVPVWCGKAKADSSTTYSPERTTCKRCLALDKVYREDLEHKRNMQKLATLREIEMAAE
jgi:hypothetical protein